MALTAEQVKQRLESRLQYVIEEISLTEKNLGDATLYHHNVGYLRGLNGTFGGQKKWLEDFIKELGE